MAVLKTGREQLEVDLLDQSRGGFLVSSPCPIRVRPSEVVTLRTNMGWTEADVMHVHQQTGATRIGLRRRRELIDPRQLAALHRNSAPRLAKLLAVSVILLIAVWICSR